MEAAAPHGRSGLCARDRTNLEKLRRWFLLFGLTFLLAVVFLGPTQQARPWWHFALAILPLLPGYFASCAYLKFLREADELIKNIHYEAASKSFILVMLLGFAYCLASQVFGEWEDAGAVLWVIATAAYQINYRQAWRHFDV